MDLEYYRDFLMIVESGTISGAARRLSIAQPALSNRLKQLEQYLDTTLIETTRGSRNIELTEAGEYLYEEAKHLLATEDNLKREITNRVQGLSGVLTISLSPSTAMMFISDYLVPFSRAYPNLQFRLHEVSIADQTKQLLDGTSEIGVANAPLRQPDKFNVIEGHGEHLLIAASRQNKWNRKRLPAVPLKKLKNLPLSLSLGCSNLFLDACRRINLRPRVLSICTTRTAALIWARENRSLAIVPEQTMENFSGELFYTRISTPNLMVYQRLVTVRNRSLTKLARNFLKFHGFAIPD